MALELSDVIQSHIERSLERLYTAMPAIITDVSKLNSHNVVSVQPAIQKKLSDGYSYNMPILLDVPVQWQAGGGAVMTFPLKVGDDVTVIFYMNSKADWWLAEDIVSPTDRRHHSLSDGVVIPSVFRKLNHPSTNLDDVEIRYKDGEITIKKDSTVEFNNAEGSVTVEPNGQITLFNSNGSITLQDDGNGVADCPLFTFTGNVQIDGTSSADGAITSLASVGAPMIAAGTSLTVNSVEVGSHTHGYDNNGTPDTTDPMV